MAGAFLSDAVVMIGENPESLASWMAVRGRMSIEPMWMGGVRLSLPIWPTDDAPPKITMGFPLYLPTVSGVVGASSPSPYGWLLYSPM